MAHITAFPPGTRNGTVRYSQLELLNIAAHTLHVYCQFGGPAQSFKEIIRFLATSGFIHPSRARKSINGMASVPYLESTYIPLIRQWESENKRPYDLLKFVQTNPCFVPLPKKK